MERIALLNSLPFLYHVTPVNGAIIWKQHWDLISQDLASKNYTSTSSYEKMFPCHAVSIEPIAHHCGHSAGVAFFSKKKSYESSSIWNHDNSMVSTEDECGDPALVNFTAYLLSAHHERSSFGGETTSPSNRFGSGYSPALSSASTAMTNSNSPRTPKNGRAPDGMASDETSVLYFVIDNEMYCVDHFQIRSMEIEEATKGTSDENKQLKPMSLLLTFDSCTLRVFYDNVISNTEDKPNEQQETLLQSSFLKLKSFMLSSGTKFADLRSSNDSFLSYLSQLVYPDHPGESSHGSQQNGQTSDPSNNTFTSEGMQAVNRLESNGAVASNPILSRIDAYKNSWNSLKSIHCLLKLHQRGKIAGNLDQDDKFFLMLANKSARECRKSYLDSDDDMNNEELRTDNSLTEIQESLDKVMLTAFPPKKHNSSKSNKNISNPNNADFESQIRKELTRYKSTVKAKHRTLGFIPKR